MRLLLLVSAVGIALLVPQSGRACGDKFLVPGTEPSLARIHRPPRALEILIYGDPSSPAIQAVSRADFSSTLKMVGHKVVKCDDARACASALSGRHFDVVLADPKDAATLREQNVRGIVPVMLKPSKAEMGRAKREYSVAFDASRDAVRLLPILVKAAKHIQ